MCILIVQEDGATPKKKFLCAWEDSFYPEGEPTKRRDSAYRMPRLRPLLAKPDQEPISNCFFFALMTCERIFMNFQHFSISMNFTICREYQWMAIASYPRGDVQHIMDSLVVYPSFRAMQMFAASFGCSFNHSVHVGWKMRWQDLVEVRTLTENLATWQQLQILGGRQMQNLTRIKKPSTWISFHRLSCVFLYS